MKRPVPLVLFPLSFLLWPGVARADLFGGDVGVLSALLVQATNTVTALNEGLKTARESYDEMKRYAGYADEAAQAFQQFSQLNGEMLRDGLGGAFQDAFPELRYIRVEADRLSGGARWAEGDGSLRRMLSVCLGAGDCTQVREAASFRETRQALASIFGHAPEELRELQAVDDEAAIAIAQSSAQEGRGAISREYARQLMRQCQQKRAADSKNALAACQAAASAAQIAGLETDAAMADGLAQGNRLQALQLALKSQDRKREVLEAQERRELLLLGAQQLTKPPPRLDADGFDLVKEGAQ